MKLECVCGSTIRDDGLPTQWKAHLRPDLSDSGYVACLADELERTARAYRSSAPSEAESKLRVTLEELGMVGVHLERAVYECGDCGRLCVRLPTGGYGFYVPEQAERGVLRPSDSGA